MRITKRTILGLFVGMLCVAVYGSEEFIKEGKLTLQRRSKDSEKEQVIQVGEKVIFKVNAYIDDFIGGMIINANAKLINLTDDTQRVHYVITFYDVNKNIVGAYAAKMTLDPKDDTSFGSALIDGELEDFKKVTSYRLYACSYKTVPKK